MTPFTPPEFPKSAYNCPYCGAYASQWWEPSSGFSGEYEAFDFQVIQFAKCSHCANWTVWRCHDNTWRMTDPCFGTAPMPNSDLTPDVLADYEEARSIAAISPRSSAALLRLAIQKLCIYLGEKGDNLNDDIKNLVKSGLPVKVQQALDIVRVIGNNAVHPGELNISDDSETVSSLFGLVNLIAYNMITQPKEISELYGGLPQGALEAISKRDGAI